MKKKKMKLLYSMLKVNTWIYQVGLVIILLLVLSCSNRKSKDNDWKNIAVNAVQTYKGKAIIYPDSVSNLFFQKSEIDTIMSAPLKIITYIDGECSVCVLKLTFWKNFQDTLNQRGNFTIPLLIFASAYSGKSFWETTEVLGYRGAWIFDYNRRFITENKLLDERLQTVLVDKENKILLIGDPYWNVKLKELYYKTILSAHQSDK